MNKKKARDQKAELEKSLILNPQKIERDKQNKRKKLGIIWATAFCAILCCTCILLTTITVIGKNSLKHKSVVKAPQLVSEESENETGLTEDTKWKSSLVRHNGKTYAYNEDILTFLFMGIDKRENSKKMDEGTNGGQADALFLLVMNPHDKTIRVIGINRNAMTDIDVYNSEGAYMTTMQAQIAVQHGFGDGFKESCKYQTEAVQKLFYNLPIHGYCAVNMDAVSSLTDLVGGIRLSALEDVKPVEETASFDMIREGESVLLNGDMAFSYVRYRDVDASGSADRRLDRQKQFLGEFIKEVKLETEKDITLPVKLYQAVSSKMVSDISVDEVAYLASIASGYSFQGDQLYLLKGETVQGKRFEEFYIDEEDLYELILKFFYEETGEYEK